jgi:hypothetical protein
MSIQAIHYKNKLILYNSYRGLASEDMLRNFDMAAKLIEASPAQVLLLNDFEGTAISPLLMDRAWLFSQPAGRSKVVKSAILGIHGIQSLLVDAINMASGIPTRSFANESSAKEWLVS